ncbi:3-deoxy-D-manno-octulosonate 8-phosphate phosphatase (KDO 8-P phosphatase) [Parelusimicrobium proximum]|uniref:KdsC family phosphatase n=1 Tax=Parelusimicrobium proximum TaxID=3228953 RepID=UPI003D18441F
MENTERAKKIKFLLTDVDGVLTDGKLNFFTTPEGKIEEFKSFNATDGLGFMVLTRAGIASGIITGRAHPTTEHRAKTSGMKYIYQNFTKKINALEDLLSKENISLEEIAYIGDDLIDLPVLTKAGLACCPADAAADIKKVCHYISSVKGGDGAARDVIEFILKAQGRWDEMVEDVKNNGLTRPKYDIQIITDTHKQGQQ